MSRKGVAFPSPKRSCQDNSQGVASIIFYLCMDMGLVKGIESPGRAQLLILDTV